MTAPGVLERRVAAAPGGGRLRRRRRELGEAEVEDLDQPALVDHDVAGLDVAVDDAALVRLGQRLRHLSRDRERVRGGRAGPRCSALVERPPAHVLHGDEAAAAALALGLADLVDHRDVRVVEGGGHASLAQQPGRRVLVRGRVRAEHLEGHRPVQAEVLGQIHVAHAPVPRRSPMR